MAKTTSTCLTWRTIACGQGWSAKPVLWSGIFQGIVYPIAFVTTTTRCPQSSIVCPHTLDVRYTKQLKPGFRKQSFHLTDVSYNGHFGS